MTYYFRQRYLGPKGTNYANKKDGLKYSSESGENTPGNTLVVE